MIGRQRVSIGGAQVIQRDLDTGVLQGGTEPRKDGAVGCNSPRNGNSLANPCHGNDR